MDTVINILTNHNMVVIFVTLLQLLEFRGKGWVEGFQKKQLPVKIVLLVFKYTSTCGWYYEEKPLEFND